MHCMFTKATTHRKCWQKDIKMLNKWHWCLKKNTHIRQMKKMCWTNDVGNVWHWTSLLDKWHQFFKKNIQRLSFDNTHESNYVGCIFTNVLTITHKRDHYVSLVQRLGQSMVKFMNSITRPTFPIYLREKKTIGYKW